MDSTLYRVYRRNGHGDDLSQIDYTAASLDGAKKMIQQRVTGCQFESTDNGQVFAIVNGEKMFRLEPVVLT